MKYELRTTNYRLNTSDKRQATCDEFAPFWSFYVSFCTFYASLRLTRTVFTRLMKKANNHLYSLPLIPGPQSLTHNPLTNMMIQSKTNNHLSLILNHLYGLHNFAFYILIFAFSLTSYGINSTKE
jgi:hypothetical protein